MKIAGRIRHAEWLERNRYHVLLAIAFFIANQLVEALAIRLFEFDYAKLCSWDCVWYASIVQDGYDLQPHAHPKGDAANWAFFPAFPLAARMVGLLVGQQPGIALVLTSKLFFLLSIYAFLKFALAYRPHLDPLVLGSVAAFNPYSIYGSVGYSESLFLLLTCAFFYALRRGNHVAAGVAGAILTSTRVVGILAVLSYLWTAVREPARDAKQRERMLLGLFLIPLGLALFMAFLYYRSGDALAFSHIQRAWDRLPGNPLGHLLGGFVAGGVNRYWALMSVLALLVPVYFAVTKNVELAVFSLGATLIPLSTGVWAMPRYIWWQAPVLLALAVFLNRRLGWIVYLAGALMGLTYMYVSWLSGKDFVI